MLELRELPGVLHIAVRSMMRPLPTCRKHTGSALTEAGETLLSTLARLAFVLSFSRLPGVWLRDIY